MVKPCFSHISGHPGMSPSSSSIMWVGQLANHSCVLCGWGNGELFPCFTHLPIYVHFYGCSLNRMKPSCLLGPTHFVSTGSLFLPEHRPAAPNPKGPQKTSNPQMDTMIQLESRKPGTTSGSSDMAILPDKQGPHILCRISSPGKSHPPFSGATSRKAQCYKLGSRILVLVSQCIEKLNSALSSDSK